MTAFSAMSAHGQAGSYFARRVWTLGIGFTFALGGIALSVLPRLLGSDTPTELAPLLVGIALVMLGLAQSVSGLFVRTDAVYIVNVVRLHRVSLKDIQEFGVERWLFFPRICVARLRSGRHIAIWALPRRNPSLFNADNWMESVLAHLNGLLGSPGPTGGA